MVFLEQGIILSIDDSWRAVQVATIKIGNRNIKGLLYNYLVGIGEIGDKVVVNTNALRLSLGTGGYGFVTHIIDKYPQYKTSYGHIIKNRYTPFQIAVDALDDPKSPYHDVFNKYDDIDRMPVIVADLHSALLPICLGILYDAQYRKNKINIVYIMVDSASLPVFFSKTVSQLLNNDIINAVISTEQSFGGTHEVSTIINALIAAKYILKADVCIVIQGPGNVGTDTKYGFSGIKLSSVIHYVDILNGINVGMLRISSSDKRKRHYGISHHSLTLFDKLINSSVTLPLPNVQGDKFWNTIYQDIDTLTKKHNIIKVDIDFDIDILLKSQSIPLETMGRSYKDDIAYFLIAVTVGYYVRKSIL